jgi:cytochrome b pre-mRNA-processing protein 3
MLIERLFARRPAKAAGQALYASAAGQARSPGLYLAMGVPDTPEGRFELYTLHVVLVLHRLKGQGEQATETSQVVFDVFVRALDGALHELGVGYTGVPKRMKRLGQAFYGRVKSYEAALAALPSLDELQAVVAATVLAEAPGGDAGALATYAAEASRLLAAQPLESLLQGRLDWPAVST